MLINFIYYLHFDFGIHKPLMIRWRKRRIKVFSLLLFLSFGSGRAYGLRLNKLGIRWVSNMMRSIVGLSLFSFLAGIINGFNGFYTIFDQQPLHKTQFIGMKNEWRKKSLLFFEHEKFIHTYPIAKNRWLFPYSSVRHIFIFDFVSKYILFFDHFYSSCFESFVIQVLFIFTRSCNNTRCTFSPFWNRHGLHMDTESCWKFNFVCKIKRIESLVLCATDPLRWYRFAT